MSKKDGGSAFPQSLVIGPSGEVYISDGFKDEDGGDAGGMTMRQFYKAAALTGLLANVVVVVAGNEREAPISGFIKDAANFADAMIAEDEEASK